MKRLSAIFAVFIAAAGACLGVAGADADFSRYSLILERKPFGVPPPPDAAGEGAALSPDSFATYVRLTALMQEEGTRVRVGFVDKKQKDKSYMLGVGEKADDYEVLEADVAAEIAKLRKGTEEQWLSMKTPGAVAAPGHSPAKAGVVRSPVPLPFSPLSGAGGVTNAARRQSRYAAIRRAEIEREKQAEEARKLNAAREPQDADTDGDEDAPAPAVAPPPVEDDEEEDEVVIPVIQPEADEEEDEDADDVIREAEIQQHLQSYQKELIKQGLPPLPIPLTAQTDAELVKEGVLPPIAPEKDDD